MDIQKISDFFEQIANLSESVYWLSSADLTRIIYISPAYEKIWGRSRQELYDDPEKWITYLHPDDVKNYHPIHQLAEDIQTLGSSTRYRENYRIIRPNGEIRYILDRGFTIYIDGICQGVTGFSTDITEDKLTEDELKKVKYQLEGAKLISGSIAHEIRTPLATVKSTVLGMNNTLSKLIKAYEDKLIGNLIKKQEIENLKEGLSLIDRKINQSNAIINMLLTKLQSIDFDFKEFEIVSAQDCIRNALMEFVIPQDMLNKIKHIEDSDFKFLGNITLVTHIIMNLLKNAIFYIQKAKKGVITIWVEQHTEANEIHFKDTAFGIKETILPHIFDAFFTTEASTGTGVGLAFSKMVMQSHKGAIECFSKESEYTEFVLSFPKLIEN